MTKDPLYMRETGLREAPAGELAWQALEKMSRKGVAFWWAEVSKVALRAWGEPGKGRKTSRNVQERPSEQGGKPRKGPKTSRNDQKRAGQGE